MAHQYSPNEERPLKGYAMAMGLYTALVAGIATASSTQKRKLPSPTVFDFAMGALATHKLSRIISKDAVTSPLRAPVTEYVKPAGGAELIEETHEHGAKHAFGELISCPFCLDVWIATAFTAGSIFAPAANRLAASTFSMVAVSDFLHYGYDKLKKANEN